MENKLNRVPFNSHHSKDAIDKDLPRVYPIEIIVPRGMILYSPALGEVLIDHRWSLELR